MSVPDTVAVVALSVVALTVGAVIVVAVMVGEVNEVVAVSVSVLVPPTTESWPLLNIPPLTVRQLDAVEPVYKLNVVPSFVVEIL